MIRYVVLLIALLTFSFPATARWEIEPAPQGMGTKWLAVVINEQGHKLVLRRKIARAGYEVYAEVTLKGEKFADSMPIYQIDDGRMEDTLILRTAGENMGLRWGYVEDNVSGWRIWQSTDAQLRPGDSLEPWIHGSRVTIRYRNAKGQDKQTVFTLAGSAGAIKEAVEGPFR